MEPCRTPALTRYSCEDFHFRTTRSCILLRKDNNAKYLTWNSSRRFWRRPACQTLSNSWSSAIAYAAPDLSKALVILSDTIVRRSAVDQEDLKIKLKIRKKKPQERRLTGQYLLGVEISPIFLNTRTTNDTFKHSGKQDYFRHISKRPASMYEKLGSQFFRITANTTVQILCYNSCSLLNITNRQYSFIISKRLYHASFNLNVKNFPKFLPLGCSMNPVEGVFTFTVPPPQTPSTTHQTPNLHKTNNFFPSWLTSWFIS